MFTVVYLFLGSVYVIMSSSEDIGGLRPEYCHKGFYGLFCKDECYYPFYGKYCAGICRCDKKFCNFMDGCQAVIADRCPDGYAGKLCTMSCIYPHYGQACQRRCLCPKKRCNSVTGCINVKPYSEVKIKTEVNTDSVVVTSVTPREHGKTTRLHSQTHKTADRNEAKLKGTDCINITSNPFEAKEKTNSTIHLIDTTMANNVFPTSMINTEKRKRRCSQLEDAKDDNSPGFWLFTISKNRGITISLTVVLALLILSLIGHLVLSAFRCAKGKYKSPSLNQASV